MGPGRKDYLCAGGERLQRRLFHPVAPGRAGADRNGPPVRRAGRVRAGQRGGLSGLGLHRSGGTPLGYVRQGNAGGPDQRDHQGPHLPGDSGGDRLPDRRPDRRHGAGCRASDPRPAGRPVWPVWVLDYGAARRRSQGRGDTAPSTPPKQTAAKSMPVGSGHWTGPWPGKRRANG